MHSTLPAQHYLRTATWPRLALVASWVASTSLSGCMIGPDYLRPPAPVAEAWIEEDNPNLSTAPPDDAQWWTVFNDPVLDDLVFSAYQQNLPLREAGMRVLEARAQRAIAAGNLFPQFQEAFGNYSRQVLSLNGSPVIDTLPTGALDRSFDFWSTGFDAAWEIDIWGRFRRAIQAADADLDASIEDYDDILVTLVGDVAATYVQMRTFERRLELAHQNVKIQQGSLHIAEVRFRNGAVTELDVQQAKSSVAQTEALIPVFEQGVRQTQNALCILLGLPPRDLTERIGVSPRIPITPPQVAVGIPADLLRRRPDVRREERILASQSARIGIAETDFYPRLTISGNIGVQATEFNELFTSPSFAGAVSPGFNWNILNYGRILNNVRVQEARFDQLALRYQNTVLAANKEVEDALVAFFREQEKTAHLAEAAQAAERSVELVMMQYRDGAVDFNRVFNLQELLVQQQDALAASRGTIATNLVAVYKALGGGWQIRYTNVVGPAGPVESLPAVPANDDAVPPSPAAPLPPAT
ncbi:MAG: efflux transporter outer membrane subunit [Pirellulales bacterium]